MKNQTSGLLAARAGEISERTLMALELIAWERRRQDKKWGTNRMLDDKLWLTILAEEFGEAAQEILEDPNGYTPDKLLNELVQIAAVATAWIENMDAREAMRQRTETALKGAE